MGRFVQVRSAASNGTTVRWRLVPSGAQMKISVSLGGVKVRLHAVPKAMSQRDDLSRADFEQWLGEKLGVIAEIDNSNAVISPFRSKKRERAETSFYEYPIEHQLSMKMKRLQEVRRRLAQPTCADAATLSTSEELPLGSCRCRAVGGR